MVLQFQGTFFLADAQAERLPLDISIELLQHEVPVHANGHSQVCSIPDAPVAQTVGIDITEDAGTYEAAVVLLCGQAVAVVGEPEWCEGSFAEYRCFLGMVLNILPDAADLCMYVCREEKQEPCDDNTSFQCHVCSLEW